NKSDAGGLMVYLVFCSQVPSKSLCDRFASEAAHNMRSIEKAMNTNGVYEGFSFEETCEIHEIQFRAFLKNLKVYQRFSSVTR
ncbi:hypothetical protein CGI42_25075, partial [Vibrio parahaemolyticus]